MTKSKAKTVSKKKDANTKKSPKSISKKGLKKKTGSVAVDSVMLALDM